MQDITNLASKTAVSVKINEVKGEIPSINNLATNTALTAIENKISDAGNLVKKPYYNTKISETEKKSTDHDHDKYIISPEFKKLTAENFAARLAQEYFASKSDIPNFVKKIKQKVTSNKTTNLLVENEFKNAQTFDSSLFIGQRYFNNDRAQVYLIFQPIYKTITTFSGLPDTISDQESKGLSNETFKPPYTANKSLSQKPDVV